MLKLAAVDELTLLKYVGEQLRQGAKPRSILTGPLAGYCLL
jgi:hypothetical protein